MACEMTRATVRDPEAIAFRLDDIREKVGMLIENGDLRPGERANEQALAAQPGVSRNAAREALRSLEHSGLVTIIPDRGVAGEAFEKHVLTGKQRMLDTTDRKSVV